MNGTNELLHYFVFLKNQNFAKKEFTNHRFYFSRWGLLALFLYLAFYLGSYGYAVVNSLPALEGLLVHKDEIATATMNSIFLFIIVLILFFVLLVLWLIDYIFRCKENLAEHLISVSTVLVGFSLYVFFPQNTKADFLKIPSAFLLLFFPALFKIFFSALLNQICQQIVIAKIFQVNIFRIIFRIILPQCKNQLLQSSALLLIWTLGDFAIARALGTQSKTLGLLTETFLSSYRLESAYLISFYILVIWAILSGLIFLVTRGIYGTNKKY